MLKKSLTSAYGVYRAGFIIILFQAFCSASPINDKIQEAAYILRITSDTSKAEKLLISALNSKDATQKEKLSASLYLAKIAEAKMDSAKALEYYRFIKNNAQNTSLAYMASEKEFFFRENFFDLNYGKVKISRHKQNILAKQVLNEEIPVDSIFLNCKQEGELYLTQHIVYNCPNDNSLHLIHRKSGKTLNVPFPFISVPAKVFLVFDGFFLYSGNTLSFYRLKDGLQLIWGRIPTLEVQDIDDRGDKFFILDISGRIDLRDKNSGEKISSAMSDGEALFKAGTGLIGTYQKNGGISVFDSLLNHLWDYQIDGEILESLDGKGLEPPILKGDSVIFNLSNGYTEILYTRHYQKFSQSSGVNVDSLLSLESGNASAWYNLALRENNDSLWNKAVIYGSRREELSPVILAKYAEKIGAKWIRHLHLSSKMLYPKILTDAGWLFVLDTESQELLKFSLENGTAGGNIILPRDRKYLVEENYELPWLTLRSDYRLLQFSLRDQSAIPFDISGGEPISFLRNNNSIYIGLVNGFVLKYFAPKMHLESSHKVSSAPVFLGLGESGVYSLSQNKIALFSQKIQIGRDIGMELNGVPYFKFKNGIFAVASSDGIVQVYSEKDFILLGSFSVSSDIISFELLEHGEKIFALVGTVNQMLSLFELPSGKLSWAFNSKGSAIMRAVPNASYIWLDQNNSIVAIDINTGKVVKSHKILGNGAFILINGNTLYCATPQKLLYAFPID